MVTFKGRSQGGENLQKIPLLPVTTYQIKGFRSLIDFEIGLTEGINVFVGPNGSGKTNFIEFLDFLSNTVDLSASTAVSRAGGVSRVFSLETVKQTNPCVTAVVKGVADINHYVSDNEPNKLFNFEYDLEVRFSRSLSLIYISKETIKFKRLRTEEELHLGSSSVGTISISRGAISLEQPTVTIGAGIRMKTPRNPLTVRPLFLSSSVDPSSKLESLGSVGPDESILSGRHGLPAIDAVRSAISRGRSFNLIPEKVRAPDDLTRSPIISPDGSGLTATLYQLQQANSPRKSRRTRLAMRRSIRPEFLDQVIEWTKLVFKDLQSISVSADPHTGKYIGYVSIGSNDLKIPLQSVSDGTLKWLALVTLIVTRGGAYSIEEPENFLHPTMQKSLVDLIREYTLDRDDPGYFIISTHSETIVNKCRPSELILFHFRDGRTSCGRLTKQDTVQRQINETGFGLGYYYANNSVS